MDALLHVSHDPSIPYYDLFYASALIGGGIFVYLAGRRKGWPPAALVALICSCIVGAVIGSKLLTLPLEAWQALLHGGGLSATSSKTLLGGLLGGTAAVALVRRALRVPSSTMDLFVWPILLLVPLGRLGCLLVGCCFGSPAGVPWAITYGSGSMAHHTHVAEGLIGHEAATSLAVHPIPLYEIGFFLLLVATMWRLRGRELAPGVRFYGVMLFYGVFRFAEEFFRHTSLHADTLTSVQWGLIPAVAGLAMIVGVRQSRWALLQPRESPVVHASLSVVVAIHAALSSIVWLGSGWFTDLEVLVLTLVLVSASVFLLFSVARALLASRLPLTPIMAALVLPVGLGVEAARHAQPDTLRTRYLEVGGGAMSGTYFNRMLIGWETGGCGGRYPVTIPTSHSYRVGGVDVRHVTESRPDNRTTLGIRLFGGSNDRSAVNPSDTGRADRTLPIWGVNPYVQWDRTWWGLGAGVHVGEMLLTRHDEYDYERFLMPALYARLGRENSVFVDASVGSSVPASSPAMWLQAGGGIGLPLGEQEHVGLRAGVSEIGWYVNPTLRVRNRLTLYSTITWGREDTYPGHRSESHVGGGLYYRIPLR
jgi:prolipoprotein diacylglyceryltransferase